MSLTGSGRHVHLASAHPNRITTPTHTTPKSSPSSPHVHNLIHRLHHKCACLPKRYIGI